MMDYLTEQTYVQIKLFDLYSNFADKAKKINAQVNFYLPSLIIYKDGKYVRLNFYQKKDKVVNKNYIGYVDVSYSSSNFKIYLTDDFDWIVNIENRITKKLSSVEIEYIFYKTYGVW